MDAFEIIVAALLEAEGFWVRRSVRLELPVEQRRHRSAPRSELDIVALRPSDNELWMIECKSFLDSAGVRAAPFLKRALPKYRLFLDDVYWAAVQEKLVEQLNLASQKPRMRRCLVAGKIARGNEAKLRAEFEKNEWELREPCWIRKGLENLERVRYQNDAITMAMKLRSGGADGLG